MHRSNRLSLGIFLALLPAIAFAQSITYQPPTDFFACGEASFCFTVQNPTGSSLNGATVTVNFTTTQGTACGVAYVAGSVTSPATEGNISNLSAPQFALPTIAAGSSLTFSINASANCVTAACIDNAEVFINNITLSLNGGSSTVTTNPYVIDRALLLITNVSATVMSGSRGEVLQRKITVRNTRPGALSSFLFTDTHQPGIAISSQQGTAQPAPLGSFASQLGPADFASIGDGDGLFELNETIVITEDISILSCGVDESSCLSTIKVGWGCGGDICQEENVTAVIAFEQYEKAPVLTWEPIINVPECFCGPNAVQQGMKITNVGDGNAVNISFDVQSPGQNPQALIDPASVRVVSGGVDIPFNLLPSGNVSVEPYCDMPAVVTVQFVASGFNLTPGQSVTVFWDNYYCSTGCAQPGTEWRYRYSYFKDCPPDIFTQELSYISVSEQGVRLSTFVNVENGPVVMDGETRTTFYQVSYDSLDLLNGSLSIDMELPCGMEWVPSNQMLLAGQAPASIDVVDNDSLTLVTAVYNLPLPADTALMSFDFVFHCDTACGNVPVCDEVLETSCATPCQADPPPVYFADVVTSLIKCSDYPSVCNLQSCTSLVFGYDCAVDSICLDQPPGYLRYEFSALRKNYGLPDNDNNQFADAATGLPNLSLVARQRFMPGDTVQATVRGVVEMDVEGASLPFGELELSFFPGTRMAPATRTTLLTPDGFKPAGSLLRIYDSSAGQWYECPDPAFTNSMFIRFTYDLDALDGGCLPAGFAFGQGDSLEFVGNYRINLNPAFESGGGSNDTDPLFGNIFASPAVRLYDENAEDYTIINCFCEAEELELTYYQYTLTAATFGLPPCDTSEFNQAMGFRIDLHQGNFFPFEYRPLLSVDELLLELPPSVELCTTRLINIRQQNGANVATQVFFPPNFQDGGYLHDLTNLQTPPLEEGFSANLNFRFKNDCTNKLSLPMTYNTLLDWEPGLPEEDDPETVSVTANSLRPLIANLSISAPLFDLVSYTNQLGFDFMLKNTPTIVSSLNSGPAPNTWMYISSQSGLVTDFQLINQTTGQPVPLVNGLWQLGDLPVNPTGFPYRLVGTNNSCEREALQIHYGWNCDPMQSTVQAPCYEQVQPLFIESPPGEIDMLVTSPTGCSQLCDTVPYHRIEVFNAQFGTVYQLSVNAFLPPGMSVLPGSCEVEYPTGSGQFYPIADPTAVSTGIVEWNLSMLFDSIANGLPGVADAPRNSLTLQFLGETTCDFVADAYSLFIAAAELNCGLPSNTIAKPGDPICIEGVSAPYTTSISVNPVVGLSCADARSYEVSLMSSAALPPGACLIVTLPPGISYQPGSCENQCPTAFNCAPTVDGSQITWQLPAGVLPNQILCFRFATQGWNGLGCEEGVLLFRTAAETQALCVATGEVCSTKVSTGSLILPFEPQQPAYDLSNFSVSATSVGSALDVTFSVDMTNNGAASQPPTLLDFYVDTDGDGDGDQLVFTESYNSPIAAGQTVTVTVPALLGGGLNLCQLVAVIDASQQCACSGDVALVTSPIEYETGLAWTLCSGASQTIGVAAQPGFDYQWSPDDCLADDQAAMTVFSCENDGIVAETYAFSLSQSNGFCEINNLLNVRAPTSPPPTAWCSIGKAPALRSPTNRFRW
ncbi:MAG: hypothetical protein MUC59_06370 [Saprospiraceae bacterium]|nr:hypothetical protein [Saprospiraceae bacterium]